MDEDDIEIAETHVMSAEIPLSAGEPQTAAIKEAAHKFTEAVINGRKAAKAAYSSKD